MVTYLAVSFMSVVGVITKASIYGTNNTKVKSCNPIYKRRGAIHWASNEAAMGIKC